METDLGVEAKTINDHTSKLARHNSTIASISRTYRSGVGSKTFNFQSKTLDIPFNKAFEQGVKLWSEKGNCEIRDQKYRGMIERDIVDAYAVKQGGVIVRHHFDEKFECGYKMELVPLYMVNTSKVGIIGSSAWVNGFKVNKYGAITHVAILENVRGTDNLASKDVPIAQLEIAINPWADMIQYSGVSPVLAIKETLEYIDQYKAKEMRGAGNRSDTPLIIKTPWFREAFENMKARIIEARANTLKAAGRGKVVWSDQELNVLNEGVKLRRLDTKVQGDVGRFAYIADDEELVETGKGVVTIYPEMYDNESKLASAAMGLTASSVVGQHESSYNAALKGAQGEEREFKIIFDDTVWLIWHNVYKKLQYGMILKGMLTASDYFREPGKYFKIEVLRAEIGHIDPSKTAKAVTEMLKNGTTNKARELRRQGLDPEEFLEERKEYFKMEVEKFRESIEESMIEVDDAFIEEMVKQYISEKLTEKAQL